MEVPMAMPGKALFSTGNLAAEDERPAQALTPLGFAAAGMALCERRWFHVARSALPGCAHKYRGYCQGYWGYCQALMPLGFAAAGMALCERRWFHTARTLCCQGARANIQGP